MIYFKLSLFLCLNILHELQELHYFYPIYQVNEIYIKYHTIHFILHLQKAIYINYQIIINFHLWEYHIYIF